MDTLSPSPMLLDEQKTFSLETVEDIARLAKRLVDGGHPGVLTTIDEEGFPTARWMSTLTCDDFPRLVTLTSPRSRKLAHIRNNPHVGWLFLSEDEEIELQFAGRAQIRQDTPSIKRAWRAVKDKGHAYFLDHFSDKPGIAVIETIVERADCTVPRLNVRVSRSIAAPP